MYNAADSDYSFQKIFLASFLKSCFYRILLEIIWIILIWKNLKKLNLNAEKYSLNFEIFHLSKKKVSYLQVYLKFKKRGKKKLLISNLFYNSI